MNASQFWLIIGIICKSLNQEQNNSSFRLLIHNSGTKSKGRDLHSAKFPKVSWEIIYEQSSWETNHTSSEKAPCYTGHPR